MIALTAGLVAILFFGISGADFYVENLKPDELANMGVVLRH